MDSPSRNALAGLVGLLLPFLSLQVSQLLQQHLSRGYGLYVGSAVRYGPAREGVLGSSAMRRDRASFTQALGVLVAAPSLVTSDFRAACGAVAYIIGQHIARSTC